ncbi:hypothetical protein ANN_26032 [Periplaneta americana]|uniref:Uncharacterized protein n=1 Tax=Periplaneta americana TaxID=6978 RepID=A0ABQ8S594_PERAM|nr:hypothetical protein ANN_26032 [Periplaneta americana]
MSGFFHPRLGDESTTEPQSQPRPSSPGRESDDEPEPEPGPSWEKTPIKKKEGKKSEIVIGRSAKLRKQCVGIVQKVKTFLRGFVHGGCVLPTRNINELTEIATGVGLTTIKTISGIKDVNSHHTPTKEKVPVR